MLVILKKQDLKISLEMSTVMKINEYLAALLYLWQNIQASMKHRSSNIFKFTRIVNC